MRCAVASVGLVSPRSTWESIGADTPRALGEVAQRQAHRLAQRADAGADLELLLGLRCDGHRHVRAYVITYNCMSARS